MLIEVALLTLDSETVRLSLWKLRARTVDPEATVVDLLALGGDVQRCGMLRDEAPEID